MQTPHKGPQLTRSQTWDLLTVTQIHCVTINDCYNFRENLRHSLLRMIHADESFKMRDEIKVRVKVVCERHLIVG